MPRSPGPDCGFLRSGSWTDRGSVGAARAGSSSPARRAARVSSRATGPSPSAPGCSPWPIPRARPAPFSGAPPRRRARSLPWAPPSPRDSFSDLLSSSCACPPFVSSAPFSPPRRAASPRSRFLRPLALAPSQIVGPCSLQDGLLLLVNERLDLQKNDPPRPDADRRSLELDFRASRAGLRPQARAQPAGPAVFPEAIRVDQEVLEERGVERLAQGLRRGDGGWAEPPEPLGDGSDRPVGPGGLLLENGHLEGRKKLVADRFLGHFRLPEEGVTSHRDRGQ